MEVEDGCGERKGEISQFVFEAHSLGIAHGKARGVEEVDFQVKEGFKQVGDGVGWIAVVAVQGHDDVARGKREAAFVAAPITANVFADDFGAEAFRHLRGAVGGAVINDDDLVDEFGHAGKDLLNALLFVETGDDDGD